MKLMMTLKAKYIFFCSNNYLFYILELLLI